jgi:hypothetical protein
MLNTGRHKFKLSLGKHFYADPHVGEPIPFVQLVTEHYLQLVGASVALNGIEYFAVKFEDIRLSYRHLFFNCLLTEGMCNGRDVDTVGALDGACIAANANPDARALQSLFLESQLNKPDNPVWEKIHGFSKGASAGAALAVVAEVEINTGALLHFFGKIRAEFDFCFNFG